MKTENLPEEESQEKCLVGKMPFQVFHFIRENWEQWFPSNFRPEPNRRYITTSIQTHETWKAEQGYNTLADAARSVAEKFSPSYSPNSSALDKYKIVAFTQVDKCSLKKGEEYVAMISTPKGNYKVYENHYKGALNRQIKDLLKKNNPQNILAGLNLDTERATCPFLEELAGNVEERIFQNLRR